MDRRSAVATLASLVAVVVYWTFVRPDPLGWLEPARGSVNDFLSLDAIIVALLVGALGTSAFSFLAWNKDRLLVCFAVLASTGWLGTVLASLMKAGFFFGVLGALLVWMVVVVGIGVPSSWRSPRAWMALATLPVAILAMVLVWDALAVSCCDVVE